jgi:hypothetical protein
MAPDNTVLAHVPVDAIIRGTGYLKQFIQAGMLQRLADEALGTRAVLDRFHGGKRAHPRGVVVHWLAGNVPTLGLISFMLSAICKNANILKPATGSDVRSFMEAFRDVVVRSPAGARHSAQSLLDATAVTHDKGPELSQLADVRVAWGGQEAVTAIMALPRKPDAQDIVFGPKLSVAMVSREALGKAKRVCRRLATDASVFDQAACSSAQVVFVERGGGMDPAAFAAMLDNEMANAVVRHPVPNREGLNPIWEARARALERADGVFTPPNGVAWTVLYHDAPECPEPAFGRTVFVRSVDRLTWAPLYPNIQTVALACPDQRKRQHVAEHLAEQGVARITQPGQMTDYSLPWDGMNPIERLVRWTSLA